MAGKKTKKPYIVIPGDRISRKELLLSIDRKRLGYLRFQMEEIRVSDMTEDQKHIARSQISWRARALEESIRERERS